MSFRRMGWVSEWRSFLDGLGNVKREMVRREFNQCGATQVAAEYLMFVHSGGRIVLRMPRYSDSYFRCA